MNIISNTFTYITFRKICVWLADLTHMHIFYPSPIGRLTLSNHLGIVKKYEDHIAKKWNSITESIFIFKLKPSIFNIDRSLGYGQAKLPRSVINKLIKESACMLSNSDCLQKNRKPYLIELTELADYPLNSNAFILASSDAITNAVAHYFQEWPVLWNITMMQSPTADNETKKKNNWHGSQLWHRDGEDIKNVKVWVLLQDITEDDGPTYFITKECSNKIALAINYHQGDKLQDQEIETFDPEIKKVIGKKGDIFFLDTAQCFHMGSRVLGSSPRRILMFHYVTHNASYFWPRWMDSSIKRIALCTQHHQVSLKDLKFARLLFRPWN